MISETEKSRVDLYFFISNFGKFEIECKRLFQQPGKNKQYLDEGPKRFIDLKYAKKYEYGGMIGFVITGKIEKIQDGIFNEAINFCPNKKNENLKQANWGNSFITHHEKIDNSKIKIYHLLFQFTDNE